MAVSSIIFQSGLENFLDWSPEYYRPNFLTLAQTVRKWPIKKIRTVAYVTDGEHGSPDWDEFSGIRYVAAEHIKPNEIAASPMRTISVRQDERNSRCRLQEGDVLVYSVGAYAGFAACAEPHLFPASIPRSVAIIRIRDRAFLKPGFLSVFLNSKFGLFQSYRFRAGNSQPVLALEKIKQYEIPLLPESFQCEIHSLYEDAYQRRHLANHLYTQAQQLIESELGLDKLHFDKPVGYTAQFSELELSRRFDSEHYYPAFDNLKAKLPKDVQLVPLGSVLTFCQRGKQPIYSANGLPVLNSKHILENKINLEGNRYARPTSVTGLQIQYGDVLINGTGRGTIGRTAPYLISEHPAIPDNHVTILRSSTLDPAYLSFYLNSLAGKLQVEKYQRGSSGQLELYPFDIRKFQVWEAPQPIQQEIRRLYDQATESARQSKQLLDQAKFRVEQLIEEAVQA